jgi:hypothetical protein
VRERGQKKGGGEGGRRERGGGRVRVRGRKGERSLQRKEEERNEINRRQTIPDIILKSL